MGGLLPICCGNVGFDQEVENALYTGEMAGRGGEVPVYPGCAEPLLAEWVGAEYVHGQDDMGDSFFPRAVQRPETAHAVDELVRRINESPGELTILAQAPLTNLAVAVMSDPSIAQKVKQHQPQEKLLDCFLNILAGGHGLSELHTLVRPDQVVQRAFGRSRCAEQSTISDTLDACDAHTNAPLSVRVQYSG